MKTITVMGWRRPEYLHAVLVTLKRCVGIEDYRVWVVLDHGCLDTVEVAAGEALDDWDVVVAPQRVGCNATTKCALELGFSEGDYHIHFEDDCLPAMDCLRWFEWAGGRFREDRDVFSVSAYSTERGSLSACGKRPWFTGWGWATWADRWAQMAPRWPGEDRHPWDVEMNNKIRLFRYEAYPVVGRVQNIGRDGGYNA